VLLLPLQMQRLKTPKVVRALERSVEDKSEHPRVGSEAAEALAHGHRKNSHNVLLKGLGEMAEHRAITPLSALSQRTRVVKGLHSVGKEAADAIENIQSEKKEHRRKGGCVFLSSPLTLRIFYFSITAGSVFLLPPTLHRGGEGWGSAAGAASIS